MQRSGDEPLFDASSPILQFAILDAIAFLVATLQQQETSSYRPRRDGDVSVKLQICQSPLTSSSADNVPLGDEDHIHVSTATLRQPSPQRNVPAPSPATHKNTTTGLAATSSGTPLQVVARTSPVVMTTQSISNETRKLGGEAEPGAAAVNNIAPHAAALHRLWEVGSTTPVNVSHRELNSFPSMQQSSNVVVALSPHRRGGGDSAPPIRSSPARRGVLTPQRRGSASPSRKRAAASTHHQLLHLKRVSESPETLEKPQPVSGPLSPNGNPQPWHNTVKVKRDAYGIIVESPRAQWFKTRSQRRRMAANNIDDDRQYFHENRGMWGRGREVERLSDMSISDDEGVSIVEAHSKSTKKAASPPRASPRNLQRKERQERRNTVSPHAQQHRTHEGAALHPVILPAVYQQDLPLSSSPYLTQSRDQDGRHHFAHLSASKQISPPRPNMSTTLLPPSVQLFPPHHQLITAPIAAMSSNTRSLDRAHSIPRSTTPLPMSPAQTTPIPLQSPPSQLSSLSHPANSVAATTGVLISPPSHQQQQQPPPHSEIVVATNKIISRLPSSPPPLHPPAFQSPKKSAAVVVTSAPAPPAIIQLKSLKATTTTTTEVSVTSSQVTSSSVASPVGAGGGAAIEPYQQAMRHPLLQQYLTSRHHQ